MKSFYKFLEVKTLSETERYIVSDEEKIIPRSTVQQPGPDVKPDGLWYGCGRSWIEWIRRKEYYDPDDYLHHLIPNTNKLLKINNMEQFKKFDKTYGDVGKYKQIDWQKVSQQYGGIEICPYQWKARYDYFWYYTWDAASGCIWDASIISQIVNIGKVGDF